MKKILVAIDFSSNSINALKQGLKLAQQMQAKVYVVHAYHVIKRADTMINVNRILKEQTDLHLQDLMHKTEIPEGVLYRTKSLKGEPVSALEKYSKKIQADLIIVGTQGEQNDPEVFLGPVSGGLLKQTKFPILIIPNNYQIQNVKKILFALKSMIINESDKLTPLKFFIKKFQAQLQILQIKTPDSEPEDLVVSDKIDKLNAPIETIEAENIYQGLTNYITDTDFDLVCVMRRRRKFLELLFTRSLTKKDKLHSPVPMLILKGAF